jgi:citrate lyase subunit beta/citryl-CoA lyase
LIVPLEPPDMPRRSVLFSPGDQGDLLRKAPKSGADVIVFDLEDAVAPPSKAKARETVAAALAEVDCDAEICVRINPLEEGGSEDLAALAEGSPPDSLMLPKVSSTGAVADLSDALADRELTLPILALIETAEGVLEAPAIAEHPEVDALLFGAEDLSADLGATRTPEGTEVSYARQRVVLAASAAGIDAIDTLVTDFDDTERLTADTRRSVQFGFDGKLAIHPAQVPVINDAYTPDQSEIEWATRVLEAREEAEEAGRGVFSVDGEMIDAPLIAQAERILERARAAGEGPGSA